MIDYKEFRARTLDDAIREAGEYFGVDRDKLEVDIVCDAKTGIFGLVGAKQAIIRAGRVDLPGAMVALLEESDPADAQDCKEGKGESGPLRRDASPNQGAKKRKTRKQGKEARHTDHVAPHDPGKAGKKLAEREDREGGEASDGPREDLPELDLANCDQDRLLAEVKDVLLKLVCPITGDVPCEISIAGSRVRIVLDCGDAAGLLVGRDGQTLASVQHLASRIIARRFGGTVRMQIDAGKYRERQDDRLREMALSFALRVKETGRPLSTRPLTAYQRRIVHLTLEHDGAVKTHSKGEGTQRVVIISPASGNGNNGLEDKAAPQASARRPEKRAPAGRGGRRMRKPRADADRQPSGAEGY